MLKGEYSLTEKLYHHLRSDILTRVFKDKEELNYSYNGGTINYNFKESIETYKENMNNLKGNK